MGYTPDEVQRGLHALVMCGGDRYKAAQLLEEDGLSIPAGTLGTWRYRTHKLQYEEIRAREFPAVQARAAARAEDLMARYADMEDSALDVFDPAQLSQRDLPAAMRNLATARGISVDKARTLRDQPSVVVEHRSARDILSQLADKLGISDEASVDSTAEEIDDPPAIGAG